MAFADQKSLKERSAGLVGAIVLPAALGAIFISGLGVKDIIIPPEQKAFEGRNIEIDLPPPPPEEVKPETPFDNPISQIVTPDPVIDIPTNVKLSNTVIELPPIDAGLSRIVLPEIDKGPSQGAIKPAVATPRNNPGSWVTTSDYRTVWINREWTGVARFELQVSARGRVTDCRITRSTGHEALDQATCNLIAKRARFNPAKDPIGQSVSSTYSSAISWELPE